MMAAIVSRAKSEFKKLKEKEEKEKKEEKKEEKEEKVNGGGKEKELMNRARLKAFEPYAMFISNEVTPLFSLSLLFSVPFPSFSLSLFEGQYSDPFP